MDEVFKALADPTRRELLDELYREDGQSLQALEGRLEMSRFGVMKHLKVLEEAGLLTTPKAGATEAPLSQPRPDPAHPRTLGEQVRRALGGDAHRAQGTIGGRRMSEGNTVSWTEGTAPVGAGTAVFEIYIKTTPERLWEAITDPKMRAKYSFGVETHSDWATGSSYEASVPGVVDIASGENLEVDPPRLLVQSFTALWSDEVKSLGATRVTWEIEQVGDSCRLTVVHDQLPENANAEIYGGWPMILSGLKTLLETGETIDTPGSLRYSQAESAA